MANPIISERCCTFKITPEERRHRGFELEQSKILKEIMQKTNTKIEVTTTKDSALNFCIIGKEQNTKLAKELVLNDFQTSVTLTVSVPKSIHGRLLGPKGVRLASIQDETHTKITIPRKEEGSDIIKIVGLKANAENAVRCIEKLVREFAGKTVEKVTIERNYLLFVTGPYNENLKRWEEMGPKVSSSGGLLPPSSKNDDRDSAKNHQTAPNEITFTIIGEASVVNQIKDEITQIYEDKKKKCTTVNMEVKKAQHKYILGPGGQNLRQLFAKTGVSVELPQEPDSETITLRGERSKIAPALSELYTQAHSETDEFLQVETWLHKYLIGPKKTIYIDFKTRGVDVKSYEDKIKLHGPATEVENIRDALEAEFENIRKTVIRKDIHVEPRIHGYIIGKSGATVDKIREESGAYVLVPKNDESSENITLEGTPEAVAIAEEKINAIARKYEASRKLVIDQQLHGSIIGRGGEKIRGIREKFSQVVFTFPDQGSKNNEILILGPAEEVEKCYDYLDKFHKRLQESNHQVRVPIKKDVIKYLSDAQQAIKRIKSNHKVKIDLFINNQNDNSTDGESINNTNNNNNNNNNNNSKKQNKQQIQPQQQSQQQQQQQQPQEEMNNNKKNNNNINNDEINKTSTETTILPDSTKDIESSNDGKNKKANKNKASNNKKRANQQQNGDTTIKQSPNAVSSTTSTNSTAGKPAAGSYAVIIGREEDVEAAKVKFEALLEEYESRAEFEVKIPSQLHPRLIGAGGKNVKKIMEDFKVGVKFARQGDPNPDSVILTGKSSAIEAAKSYMLKQANQFRV